MDRAAYSVLALVLFGCTDTDLYSSLDEPPLAPDRLRLTGELCTEDPASSRFPVKVLLMTDTSIDMFRADPEGYRICGGTSCTAGSMQGLIDRNRTAANVRFGFASVAAQSKAIPPPDGQHFFLPQDPQVAQAIVNLQTPQGGERDLEGVIAQIQAFVSADLSSASAGEILRTRYLVYLLIAGPPTQGSTDPGQLASQAQALKEFIYARGALEFRLNIGFVYFGESTPDCYPLGGPCTCIPGESLYCEAWCAVQGLDEQRNVDARAIYSAIAVAGDGRFQEFACAAGIDWRVPIANAAVQLVKKDIVAFNRNVRLTTGGAVADSDGDGLTDDEEIGAPVPPNPAAWDTDGDALGDMLELRASPRQDPTDATDRPASCQPTGPSTPMPDRDADLLNDCEEGLLQTSPTIPDTDGDGLPDALEFYSDTVPIFADRLLDPDGDGTPNGEEVLAHTNPRANDGPASGRDAYSNVVSPLGLRDVASMENPVTLPAITFRKASSGLVGGQGYLRWDACAQTLAWGDARVTSIPPFSPVPVPVTASGVYRLTATSTTSEAIWIEVSVERPLLPACAALSEVVATPLITVSKRNCYDVRISNIKLLPTRPANGDPRDGINRVLVFFTQAPQSRLESPGIAKVAEVQVRLTCTGPGIETCSREPADGTIELTDESFVSF